MSEQPSIPDAQPLTDYVEDGARILAILLVWGILGAGIGWLTADVIAVTDAFAGPRITGLFALAGLLNAVLYVCYRAIDYWAAHDSSH